MPLDRAHVTTASAVMLRAYPVLNLVFGVAFVFDPQGRLGRAPSLDPARAAFPLQVWGAMWLGLAALMAGAWLTRVRDRYVFALKVNRWVWLGWAVLIESAVLTQPDVSFLAGVLPTFVAVCCWASDRSLRYGDATPKTRKDERG